MTAGPWRIGAGELWILLGLGLASLILRMAGLGHLLPQSIEMDPQIALQVRALVEEGGWPPTSSALNDYPTLVAKLAAIRPPPRVAGSAQRPASLEEHLEAASSDFLRVRRVVGWFSTLLAPLSFLVARRFLGTRGGLLAASFVLFDPLHVLFSAQARSHGVITTTALLAVLAAMELRRRPTRGVYVWAGLAMALALGSLHSGVALLLPLACAHFLRERRPGPAPFLRIFWALVPLAAGFAYFYSDIIQGLAAAGEKTLRGGTLAQGGHRLSLSMFDGSGFVRMAEFLLDSNPVLTALALAGGAGLLACRLRGPARGFASGDGAVALSFALPYFLVLGAYARTEERFALPLLPFQALLAAWLLLRVASLVRARSSRLPARGVLACSLALVLALPACTSAKLTWLRLQPDTLTRVATLLTEDLPDGGAAMLAPGVDLPLFYAPSALYMPHGRGMRSITLWHRYQRSIPADVPIEPRYPFQVLTFVGEERRHFEPGAFTAFLRERDPAYVVVEESSLLRSHPVGRNFLAAVEEWGILTWRFAPDRAGETGERRLDYAWRPGFLGRLLRASALGPELRVFRRRGTTPGSRRSSGRSSRLLPVRRSLSNAARLGSARPPATVAPPDSTRLPPALR